MTRVCNILTTGAEAQIKYVTCLISVSEKLESLVRALGQVEFGLKKPVKYSKFKILHTYFLYYLLQNNFVGCFVNVKNYFKLLSILQNCIRRTFRKRLNLQQHIEVQALLQQCVLAMNAVA